MTLENTAIIKDFLKTDKDGYLFHREGKSLEFKEQFHLGDTKAYVKDFAAFANNNGGYIIFGVKDSPRELVGLKSKSQEQFKRLDSRVLSEEFLNDFAPDIEWEQDEIEIDGKVFGVFVIQKSSYKPIIARRDTDKISEGEIYYRYSGQTRRIKYGELNKILEERIEKNNEQWLKRISEIAESGPSNSAVFSTKGELHSSNDKKVLVIDEKLIKEIEFIREGNFVEKYGAKTLKLVGEIIPARTFKVKRDLVKEYPYSALEFARLVKKENPNISINDVWKCIKQNKMKYNEDYSAFVFPNKKQQEEYIKNKEPRAGIPSIYNDNALHFVLDKLRKR